MMQWQHENIFRLFFELVSLLYIFLRIHRNQPQSQTNQVIEWPSVSL